MATAPLVDWPMPPDRTVEPATEIQLYAIAIGASVPAILASATWWLHVEWIAAIAALGILIGPVLSVMEAGRMLASSWSEGVLRAAFAAPLAAAALILGGVFVWWVVTISADSAPIGPEVVVGILGFGLLVAVVAMVGGLPITLPTALVVAWLLRRAAAMEPHRARLHVGALAAGAAIAGAITLVAMQAGRGLLSGGWTG